MGTAAVAATIIIIWTMRKKGPRVGRGSTGGRGAGPSRAGPVPGPYRLLLLGPVHLEAVEGVALPVLVQLPDNQGLHSLKKGCQPGAVVPGHGLHADRLGGLGLHLGVCMLPGLGGRLGGDDAGRLATFLEKEINTQQSPAS